MIGLGQARKAAAMKNSASAWLLILVVMLGCAPGTFFEIPDGPTTAAPNGPQAPIWVGAWGDAIDNNDAVGDNQGGSNKSFRFVINPTIGGTMERVRFSNYFGTTPITIGAARLSLAKRYTSHINTAQDAQLMFNGSPSVTLAPGQVLTSDPVSITFAFGQTLAISVYLPGTFGPVARHSSIFVENYFTDNGAGDKTKQPLGKSFTHTTTDWLLINGVDVYGPYQGTLALFGSSTTDGFHSNYSDDQVYPVPNAPVTGQYDDRLGDWLAKRLIAAGYRIGIVNLGIPGDTVTNDILNTTNDTQNANQRVGHDLLTLPNLLATMTYFGSIDIRSPDCQSAPAIEAATMQMVATIHAARVPVVLATLPPSAFCTNPAEANYGPFPSPANPYAGGSMPGPANGGELQRVAFNQWVRSTGTRLPGVAGIADLDTATLDPARPDFLLYPYNSGDNQHLNGNGYRQAASAFPLNVLPPLR